MAFPTVQTRAESATTTASASCVVTMPSGVQSGDLLIVAIASADAATFSASGWTRLLPLAGGDDFLYILYKISDGSEGASVTFVSNTVARYAHLAWRISGHRSENPITQATTYATGTSNTPDPPGLNPGTADDYLWMVVLRQAGEEADDDTWTNSAPTDFGNLVQKTCGTAGGAASNVSIAGADRQLNASTLDPGTFSVDQSLAYSAATFLVHPPAAAVDLPPRPTLVLQGVSRAANY